MSCMSSHALSCCTPSFPIPGFRVSPFQCAQIVHHCNGLLFAMAEALRSALSSFKHSASNPTELESMLEEIFPGIELTRLQKSRIQAAWANLQTSASSQAQPSSGSSGQLRLEGQEPQTFTQKQLEERAIELENGYCNLGLVLGASATVQLRLEGDEPQEAFVENFNMKGESAVVILFDIQYLPVAESLWA